MLRQPQWISIRILFRHRNSLYPQHNTGEPLEICFQRNLRGGNLKGFFPKYETALREYSEAKKKELELATKLKLTKPNTQ